VSTPRVVLVDDHGLFRSGVRSELGKQVDVVGEADDVQPAIDLISSIVPDVVLLDVHLPGGGGQAVVQAVKASHPEVRFLALSASDAPEDVIAVIRAGARGYVTKTISTDELADAVRRVAAGDAVFSHRLAGFVLDAFAAAPSSNVKPSFDPELEQLTSRCSIRSGRLRPGALRRWRRARRDPKTSAPARRPAAAARARRVRGPTPRARHAARPDGRAAATRTIRRQHR
jgi:DNA-binding NarL/FixJ family response regulator